jgi:hypothetical protein
MLAHFADDRAGFEAVAKWSGNFEEFEKIVLPPPTSPMVDQRDAK